MDRTQEVAPQAGRWTQHMSREKLEPWPDTRAYTKGRGPRGLRDTCAGPASGQGDMSSGQLRALRCGWGHPVSPCGVIILPEGAASYLRLVGPCPHASGRPGPGMGPRGPDEASRRARPGLGSRRGPGLTSSTCAPGSGFLRAARSPRGLACGDCRIWLLSPCDCRGGVPTPQRRSWRRSLPDAARRVWWGPWVVCTQIRGEIQGGSRGADREMPAQEH